MLNPPHSRVVGAFGLAVSVWLLSSVAWAGLPGADFLPPMESRADQMKPGTWVRIAVTRGAAPRMEIRMAALRREGQAQWFEFSYRNPGRPPVVFKVLVEGVASPKGKGRTRAAGKPGTRGGGLESSKRVKQALMQIGEQPPIALPRQLIGKKIPDMVPGRKNASTDAKMVGRGKVKVAAGVFDALHYRRKGKGGAREDFWVSSEVPGWPMVKLRRPGLSMELVGYGASAKSQVRGKPIELAPSLLEHMDAL